MRAYILVQTAVGMTVQVAEQLRQLDGVVQCDQVTGPYDLITTVEEPDVDELGRMVYARVQQVEGITRTVTCPVTHL